jgi:two-component system LytT family response regulator
MKTANSTARRIALSPLSLEPRVKRSDRLVIRTADFIEIVPIWDIIYVEADGNYCTFHMCDGNQIMTSKTIGSYEAVLDKCRFFVRPHQSFLVNVQYVRRIRKLPYCAICMDNDKEIPVARSRRSDILSRLTAYALA